MNKKTLALILLFIVLLAGGFCLFKYAKDTKNKNQPKVSQVTSQEIKAETISSSSESKPNNYKINFSYPKFSGIKNQPAQEKINTDVKNYILNMIQADEKSSKESCNFSDLGTNAPNWQCEYDIGFNSFAVASKKILSVKMEYYQFTGGAHGGSTIEFVNYDLATGNKINWQDVFNKDTNYQKIISDYSKIDLTKQLLATKDSMSDENWISTGTKFSTDNYNTNVGFSKDSLVIIFQQYQVAAYAQGQSEVDIPYKLLNIF